MPNVPLFFRHIGAFIAVAILSVTLEEITFMDQRDIDANQENCKHATVIAT
jgi:hypothetical protein